MNTLSRQLGECLEAELSALEGLEGALQAEYAALAANDLQQLEGATDSKRVAIEAQQHSQQRRMLLLAKADVPGELKLSDQIRRLQRDHSDADIGRTAKLGESLIRLASRCNELNRRNGGLILRQQDRTRQALDVLRGVEGNPHLYSLDGGVANDIDSRSLGKA